MQAADDDEIIFVYTGGDQVIPDDVKVIHVDASIKNIADRTFSGLQYLEEVRLLDGIEKIGYGAFSSCKRLRRINFPPSLKFIGMLAFAYCSELSELGGPLEVKVIGEEAFRACTSIGNDGIKFGEGLDVIGSKAFFGCLELKKIEFPAAGNSNNVGIGYGAFHSCTSLKSVVTPLNLPLMSTNHQIFTGCQHLQKIELVGQVHDTISYLQLQSWRDEINSEIARINSILSKVDNGSKMKSIESWMESLHFDIQHYKLEHNKLMKEAMTLLELALWKMKLVDVEDGITRTKKRKRREIGRVNCGASVVITNVCSYLKIFDTK